MNKINFKWKYWLVALGVVAVCACSEDADLAQVANKHQELQNATRTANLYTKEVTLASINTLEAKVTEAMDGEELSKLQKLVVSGPMAAADFNYLKENLTNLNVLDMKDAHIRASENKYSSNYGYRYLINDTICQRMFYNFDRLKEIVLPSSALYIDSYAFAYCDSLVSVVMPGGLKAINEYAFYDCRMLSSVTLPSTLEGLNQYMFYNCDSLKSIAIPDKVKYIGYNIFQDCDVFSAIEFSPNSELDSIASQAFYGTKLKSISIPDNVRVIGREAFRNCKYLKAVSLPSNLEGIEDCVFYDCDSLLSVVIPDKVKYIGDNAFGSNDLFAKIEFSSSSELDSIANNAFYNSNLKSIAIPDSVTTIGDYAFSYCDSLSAVDFPSNLTKLGKNAFSYCYTLDSVELSDGVKQLNNHTFYRCNSLKSIKLPSQLESIGTYCITSSLIETLELPSTLKTISSYAFEHNNNLTNVVVPEGVEAIGTQAFRYNEGLKELTIPSTATSIDQSFAYNCHQLQALYWNASIDVPYNYNTGNCFLYIETDQEITVDACWKNVILNGVSQSSITIQAIDNEFKIWKEFTASEVTYTRYFGDETVPGTSSGWQTIVLPFTPDSILHASKGLIAPFNSDVEGAKPFWLRELTADGFVDVDSITPDKAYIIAMPNHSDYLDDYRLNGNITFKAKNVKLAKTPETLEASVGPDFDFHPTYNYVKKALYVYALQSQYGRYDNKYYYKNFFTRSADNIYPFNAYVTTSGGGRSSRSSFELDGRSSASRGVPYKPNTTGIPQIGDM